MDAKGSEVNRAERGGRSAKAESPQDKDFNHVKELVQSRTSDCSLGKLITALVYGFHGR